jgi:hypothetical protein
MTPQRTHQPRNEVVLDHIVRTVYRKYSPEAESSMLGYIHAWFSRRAAQEVRNDPRLAT